MPEINGVQIPFMPVGGINELKRKPYQEEATESQSQFKKVFEEEISKVKFSAHAQARMSSRDISLNNDEIDRLQSAVEKADEKHVRESLIMLNEKAFIVNIPNRTVVTVVKAGSTDSNIVTNIDSAVFA